MATDNRETYAARQSEAGAIRNLLSHAGAVAPHTREPYTEALLFGIGGGIGVGYYTFNYGSIVTMYLNTRIMTQETATPEFHATICERIGAKATLIQGTRAAVAVAKLDKALAGGKAAIVWANRGGLKYYAPRVAIDSSYHNVTVYARDEQSGQYRVADRSSQPLSLAADYFVKAAEHPMAPKFRAMLIEPPAKAPDLKKAVTDGLAQCRDQMLSGWSVGRSQSKSGLNGLEKWAELLTDTKDKAGWPAMFPTAAQLYGRLVSLYEQIETRGDPGALRGLYADFLEEAGALLGSKVVSAAAGRMRESAGLWSALARALLPDRAMPLKRSRELIAKKDEIFLARGEAGLAEMERINDELAAIRTQAETTPPFDDATGRDILAEAARHIRDIRRVEHEIFTSLS